MRRALRIFAIVALGGSSARAACQPPTRQSTCFDADELWIPAAPSRFIGIAPARAPPARTWALGADMTYLSRPIVLRAGSPDPAGREVLVADDVIDVALAAAYSPVPHLELTAVVPAALYRSGTGLVGVTSQRGPPLPVAAFRDIRLGAAHDLVTIRPSTRDLDVALGTRLEVALPTGDNQSFAGERGPIVAPSLSLDLRGGIFFSAAEIGARLRRPVEIGGARLGTQLVSTLGVGVNALAADKLSIALEGWLLPTLLSQRRTLPDGTTITAGDLAPTEWMLSARTRLDDTVFALGVGTALPLSSETRTSARGDESTEHFAGVTSPRFRAALVVRYAPGSGPHPSR
jgi:hypothetical protein